MGTSRPGSVRPLSGKGEADLATANLPSEKQARKARPGWLGWPRPGVGPAREVASAGLGCWELWGPQAPHPQQGCLQSQKCQGQSLTLKQQGCPGQEVAGGPNRGHGGSGYTELSPDPRVGPRVTPPRRPRSLGQEQEPGAGWQGTELVAPFHLRRVAASWGSRDKCQKPGGLSNRRLLSHSSGDQKSETPVWAGRAPPEAPRVCSMSP